MAELIIPPTLGEKIDSKDMELILADIKERHKKHPEEPASLSIFVVLTQIGEKFRVVQCTGEEEWTGHKRDVPPFEGEPKCPNGHTLTLGPGMAIGWIPD